MPTSDGSVITVSGNDVVRRHRDGRQTVLEATDGREIVVDGKVVVPPLGTSQRRYEGVLGTHRLNLGNGYALHGTNRPETHRPGGEPRLRAPAQRRHRAALRHGGGGHARVHLLAMASRSLKAGRERRWTGPFRLCPACGRRNFVGRALCSSCGASLRETSVPQPPEAGLPPGRRAADRIVGRPVWIGIGAALLVAALVGVSVHRTLQARGWALPGSAPVTVVPAQQARAVPAPPEPAFPRVEDRAGYQKGRRLLEAGDVRGALPPLSDATRALPNDAAVAHEYGTALMRAGEKDRGLFHLERAARLAPGISSYRMDFARALVEAGRRGPAARELEGILTGEPTNVEAGEVPAGPPRRTARARGARRDSR